MGQMGRCTNYSIPIITTFTDVLSISIIACRTIRRASGSMRLTEKVRGYNKPRGMVDYSDGPKGTIQ